MVCKISAGMPFFRAPSIKPEKAPRSDAGSQSDEESEEEEEEEEELGPPLLQPISEDDYLANETPAWSVKQTQGGAVLVSSNYWPGAYATAVNE